jgi:hypothetical protein
MWFVAFALLGVFFYIRGYKVSALFVFFFFLTKGFNLIPDEWVDLGVPLTKNSDYAFFLLLIYLAIEFLCNRTFLKIDTFVILISVFFAFLFVCVIYNHYTLGIGWSEIIRTIRYLFFLLAYFIFRTMDKEQLQSLLSGMFYVTVFCSVLFLFQIILDERILVETFKSNTTFLGITLPRWYNQPDMLSFFVFMSIYTNPLKGIGRKITMTILILALFGAFHRGLSGFFLISIMIGYILQLSHIRRVQILSGMAAIGLFIIIFAGHRIVQSVVYKDIRTIVASKDLLNSDINVHDLEGATFTFRMAHFVERNQYILESPKSILFGGALLTEDSKTIDKFFDFKVGLLEELTNQVIQVDTGDISYSILILRFGYVGTFLYLMLYFYLGYYFYKNRNNKYGLLSFLFIIMSFGVSLLSDNLAIAITFTTPMISYLIVRKTNEQMADNHNE